MSDYFESERDFEKYFTYSFFPNYQYPWILFCHQKHFALNSFIRSLNIQKFLLIDSDVMIYEPIAPYFEYYSDYQLTPSKSPKAPSAQAAFSIVNDSKIIEKICGIYSELFRHDPDILKARFETDCFTEMFGLALLMEDPSVRVKNTYEEEDSFVVCYSLTEDDFLPKIMVRYRFFGN